MSSVDLVALVVATACGLSSLIATGLSLGVWCKLRRKADALVVTPVSILKPLCGTDDELYENLVSIVRQDYPDFEVLFGTESPHDPALAVAHRVRREFPHRRIRVLTGAPRIGLNPKVCNVAMLAAAAENDWVLISDSNVRADRRYLRAMTAELGDPNVELVSSVLAGTGERTLGALLENLHLASFVAGTVCSADWVGHPCVVGKSMLLRKSRLAKLGGFASVASTLAEDYVLGQRFHSAGHRVALSAHVLQTRNCERSVGDFLARHVRWSQMRRRIALGPYLLEPLLLPGVWGLIALSLAGVGLAVGADVPHWLLPVSVATLGLRTVLDGVALSALRGTVPDVRDLAWSPVKDALATWAWCIGLVRRRVMWRGNEMRIRRGSELMHPQCANPLSPMNSRRMDVGGTWSG